MMTEEEKQWMRLIDGELSFSEQRALLATLDETPNGWKRLALGLLEAQAFQRELRGMATTEVEEPRPVDHRWTISAASTLSNSSPVSTAQSWPSSTPLRLRFSITCMTGLICIGLGMRLERDWQTKSVSQNQTSATTSTLSDDTETQQTLKLVFADGVTGTQTLELPIIDGEGLDANELLHQSAVSDELRQKLGAQGYVIYEERTYVPISLANGRQGIAPVSNVVVEPEPIVFQ